MAEAYLVLVSSPDTDKQIETAFADSVVSPVSQLAIPLAYKALGNLTYDKGIFDQSLLSLKYPNGAPDSKSIGKPLPATLPVAIELTCAGLVDVYDSDASTLLGRADKGVVGDADSVTVAVFKFSPTLESIRRFIGLPPETPSSDFVFHSIVVPTSAPSGSARTAVRAASDYLHNRVLTFDVIRTVPYRPYVPATREALNANGITIIERG